MVARGQVHARAHRDQPPRGRGVKRRDGAGRGRVHRFRHCSADSHTPLSSDRTVCRKDGRTTGLLFCQLAGWREGGLLQQKWGPPWPRRRRSGVWSGREEKEKKCADKREKSRVARKRRQDSVGRKRPIDKVSEQVVPRDKRRRGHYCLSNCGRVPLGPRERGRAV